ncbi:Anaphase-promoting complex subunit 2 [Nymphon striatum]|nr:Anaphase-promoting complex subunit 2 [Nymphon striatum]
MKRRNDLIIRNSEDLLERRDLRKGYKTTKKRLADVGVSIGGRSVKAVRFADDTALVASSVSDLQMMMDKLNASVELYGMRINEKKTKVMKITRYQYEVINITLKGRKLEQVRQYKYLGSILDDEGKCTKDVKARIAMAKQAFMKRKELLIKNISLYLKKRLVKSLIWSVALYGSETWTIRVDERSKLEAFEMWVETEALTEFTIAAEKLKAQDLALITKEWFIEKYQKTLRNDVVPEFWEYFESENVEESDQNKLYKFKDAVHFLHSQIKSLSVFVDRLGCITHTLITEENLENDLKLLLKAILLSQLPLNYEKSIQYFYNRAFKVYQARPTRIVGDETDGIECSGCNFHPDACHCDAIWELFIKVNQQLKELGLLEKLAGDTATFITHSLIDDHVKKICKGNFEDTYLEILQEWLNRVVLSWLHHIHHENDNSDFMNKDNVLQSFKNRLSHFLWEIYAKMRIDELFSIIVEYPESQPAIEDLRDCLEKTNLRANLIQTLKTAFEKRLLHPGVATVDIISAYISTIKALRVLDPTGVILQLVCEPLRKYLKTREDTVKWIVYNLTVDSNNELNDELVKGEPLILDELCYSNEETEDWEYWQPDPVDADPSTKTSRSRKSSDIVSTLVNIYGSKELFVREYRTLLADRILLYNRQDTQEEIRHLELLKLRFGESELHLPEVMIKDVIDSRRINSHIQSENEKNGSSAQMDFNVSALVLSARFWPSFREDKLELPPKVQEAFINYTKSFETLKGNRTLIWKPHLGLVSLDIIINDRAFSYSVSPVHATIIMHFETKSKWTIEELSSVMKTSTSMLRRKISFWQTQGLIKEESQDTFVLLKEPKLNASGHVFLPSEDDDDEAESAMASSHDQREEVLQVLWSYIVGMLTNLESLPLDRIHNMLKMFASQGPTPVECTIEELKQFLDRKVKEQKLTIIGDQYKLPKGA